MSKRFLLLLVLLLHIPKMAAQMTCDPAAPIIRVTITPDGGIPNASVQEDFDLSKDGNEVVFTSRATDLVPGVDTNGLLPDVFLYKRQTCTITRLSENAMGQQANDGAYSVSMSADGRYVAFTSASTNLVPGDVNGQTDIFVRDLQTGTISLASLSSSGTQGNDYSEIPYISDDGRYVVFDSGAENLVAGDTNNLPDVYVRDLQTGITTLVSVSSNETQGNEMSILGSISANNRYVVFQSVADNLAPGDGDPYEDVYIRDLVAGTTQLVSLGTDSPEEDYTSVGGISGDGRYVIFRTRADDLTPDDTPHNSDIFVRDMQTGSIELISRSWNGAPVNGEAAVQLYNSLSENARFAVFWSHASNHVPDDTNGFYDVFFYDRLTDELRIVPTLPGGEALNFGTANIQMSPDARYAVFMSRATNLTPGVPNHNTIHLYLIRLQEFVLTLNVYDTLTPTLTWGGVTWADGYEVQIDDDLNFNSVDCCDVDLGAENLSVLTTPLQEQVIYYWRVRALRTDGQPGAWSRMESFVINLL